jgi:phosphotransferase system enzyme I (PtsI)
VLRLIARSVEAAERARVPVNVCGQMSGSPVYTMLLLGLGLRQLSVTPAALYEVKKVCRSVTIAQCQAVARRALEMDGAREIKSYLREELKKAVPELVA